MVVGFSLLNVAYSPYTVFSNPRSETLAGLSKILNCVKQESVYFFVCPKQGTRCCIKHGWYFRTFFRAKQGQGRHTA